jgi:hypothetical protein
MNYKTQHRKIKIEQHEHHKMFKPEMFNELDVFSCLRFRVEFMELSL